MSEGTKGLNQEILDRLERLEKRVFGSKEKKEPEKPAPPVKVEPPKAEPPKGPEVPPPPPGIVGR